MNNYEPWWTMMKHDEPWWNMVNNYETWLKMMNNDETWWTMMKHGEQLWNMMKNKLGYHQEITRRCWKSAFGAMESLNHLESSADLRQVRYSFGGWSLCVAACWAAALEQAGSISFPTLRWRREMGTFPVLKWGFPQNGMINHKI